MERYQVVHSIGSGSFGHVSLGYDKTTNRKVALKRISKVSRQTNISLVDYFVTFESYLSGEVCIC